MAQVPQLDSGVCTSRRNYLIVVAAANGKQASLVAKELYSFSLVVDVPNVEGAAVSSRKQKPVCAMVGEPQRRRVRFLASKLDFGFCVGDPPNQQAVLVICAAEYLTVVAESSARKGYSRVDLIVVLLGSDFALTHLLNSLRK